MRGSFARAVNRLNQRPRKDLGYDLVNRFTEIVAFVWAVGGEIDSTQSMKGTIMKLVRNLSLAGAAIGMTFCAVAMPAVSMAATPDTGSSASVQSQQDNFAYAVTIHFTNRTDQSIFIGPYQTEVKPGETREISGGKAFGVDIDSNFSFGSREAAKFSVKAKNPSFGTPWIDIAGSGERSLSEGQSFDHEFQGHQISVNRGGDTASSNGYKHFNVSVNR